MALPKVDFKTEEVVLSNGSTVEVKAMSRAQVVLMGEIAQREGATNEELEQYILMASTGSKEEEVAEWYRDTPGNDVGKVVQAALSLAGLDEALKN